METYAIYTLQGHLGKAPAPMEKQLVSPSGVHVVQLVRLLSQKNTAEVLSPSACKVR